MNKTAHLRHVSFLILRFDMRSSGICGVLLFMAIFAL